MYALNLVEHPEEFVPQRRRIRTEAELQTPFVPKLVCKPSRGQDTLKIGIFGGLHGDEEAGILASYELMRWAWNDPAELQDYELHIYPICNPSGRHLRTRHSRSGVDLNREFWSGSWEPEVQYLEGELRREQYDGLLSLHSDDGTDGIYGFASGALFSEQILLPALKAASAILPLDNGPVIDGFNARGGVIKESYKGILSAPPEQYPKPLEVVWETPALAPMDQQVQATVIAVKTMLAEYRELISYAANI